MRQSFVAQLAATLCLCMILDCRAFSSAKDHLVPVEKAVGSRAAYERLVEQKLLVTAGDVARFVGFPGTVGVETAVSIYRAPGKKDSLAGNYWITATQASERLWNCIAPDAERKSDPKTIQVVRCDAPIAESTALAAHNVWLAMLSRSRPGRNVNEIVVDSSREIFSATNSSGRMLQGESSTVPKENTKALLNIALSLLEYCGTPVDQRATVGRNIEKAASDLLKRVVPRNAAKK